MHLSINHCIAFNLYLSYKCMYRIGWGKINDFDFDFWSGKNWSRIRCFFLSRIRNYSTVPVISKWLKRRGFEDNSTVHTVPCMEGKRSEAWQGGPHAAQLWEPSPLPHSGPHSDQPAPPEGTVMGHQTELKLVMRIHDILGWIRSWIRGSMPLTNGPGSGSRYFRHWPSQDANKKLIFKKVFLLILLFEGTGTCTSTSFSKIKSQKEVTKQLES